ncbi:MAG: F0F1 ATP synthase subunit B [Alphaproteobacteria bacterium]|nr:F0F1 ATP synthase subunit B [Alphaproteobacteria bacterium]
MTHLLEDPVFFYAVAFVLFLVVAWKFGRKPMTGWLDTEIAKIREELDQARKLRAEAEAALANGKAKQAAALADAQSIVQHAKEEAERLRAKATADLKFVLEKHEQHAVEHIRHAEADAVAEVRTAAVDMALAIVRKTLAEQVDDATAAKLVDQAIAGLPDLAATKAKAA